MFGRLSSPEIYAREELRAELASVMLGAELGVPQGDFHIRNHAAYLGSWIEALRKDKNEIFKAAGAAQHIADWLKSHSAKPELAKVIESQPETVPVNALDSTQAPVTKKRAGGMRM